MDLSIIPWHDSLCLTKQQPAQAELWLRRRLFTNDGMILADHRIASAH